MEREKEPFLPDEANLRSWLSVFFRRRWAYLYPESEEATARNQLQRKKFEGLLFSWKQGKSSYVRAYDTYQPALDSFATLKLWETRHRERQGISIFTRSKIKSYAVLFASPFFSALSYKVII